MKKKPTGSVKSDSLLLHYVILLVVPLVILSVGKISVDVARKQNIKHVESIATKNAEILKERLKDRSSASGQSKILQDILKTLQGIKQADVLITSEDITKFQVLASSAEQQQGMRVQDAYLRSVYTTSIPYFTIEYDKSGSQPRLIYPLRNTKNEVDGLLRIYADARDSDADINKLSSTIWLIALSASIILDGFLLYILGTKQIWKARQQVIVLESREHRQNTLVADVMSSENPEIKLRLEDRLRRIDAIEQDTLDVQKTVVDLSELVIELSNAYKGKCLSRNSKLETKVTNGIEVVTDPALVLFCLETILKNAYEHTYSGKVVVSVKDIGGQAEIRIVDTGEGIDSEQANAAGRLFASNLQKDKLGIDLWLSERYMERLGILFTLDSSTATGTSATLLLPIKAVS